MTIVLYIALLLYTFVSSIVRWLKKRGSILLYIIPLFIIWLLMNNNMYGDNQMYQQSYIYYNEWGFKEAIWGLLIRVGNLINLDFWTFKRILSAISLFVLYLGMRNRTVNMNYALFFYAISFMFMDSEVLRNFLVMPWLIFATRFLEDTSKKRNIIIYLIIILLCSLIHLSYLFYIIFILIGFHDKQLIKKAVTFITIVNCLLVVFFGFFPLVNIITNMSAVGTRTAFLETRTGLGVVPVFVLYFFMLLCIRYCKNSMDIAMNDREQRFVDTVEIIDVLLIAVLPFLLYSIHFYRLIKNITVLNYALLGNCFIKYRRGENRATVFVMTLMLSVGWFIFECNIYNSFTNIVFPVFECTL